MKNEEMASTAAKTSVSVFNSKRFGWTMLFSWAVLIIAGIVAKRVYDHAELMVFFHLPAAVCLVLSFYILSADLRKRYVVEMKKRQYQADL